MSRFEEINEARILLGLPERATLPEIKASYKKLMARWHPDKCRDNAELCEEMARKVIAAYELIMAYCGEYRFSFTQEAVMEHASEEELWHERFGDEPIWGKG